MHALNLWPRAHAPLSFARACRRGWHADGSVGCQTVLSTRRTVVIVTGRRRCRRVRGWHSGSRTVESCDAAPSPCARQAFCMGGVDMDCKAPAGETCVLGIADGVAVSCVGPAPKQCGSYRHILLLGSDRELVQRITGDSRSFLQGRICILRGWIQSEPQSSTSAHRSTFGLTLVDLGDVRQFWSDFGQVSESGANSIMFRRIWPTSLRGPSGRQCSDSSHQIVQL